VTPKKGGPHPQPTVMDWVKREKSAASACAGFVLFAISVTYSHGDELLRVVTEGASACAFTCAIILEKKPIARVLYALFLFAALLLIMLDVNISSQLSQLRSEETFEPSAD